MILSSLLLFDICSFHTSYFILLINLTDFYWDWTLSILNRMADNAVAFRMPITIGERLRFCKTYSMRWIFLHLKHCTIRQPILMGVLPIVIGIRNATALSAILFKSTRSSPNRNLSNLIWSRKEYMSSCNRLDDRANWLTGC